MTERFQRKSKNDLTLTTTMDDPKLYTRQKGNVQSWTMELAALSGADDGSRADTGVRQ